MKKRPPATAATSETTSINRMRLRRRRNPISRVARVRLRSTLGTSLRIVSGIALCPGQRSGLALCNGLAKIFLLGRELRDHALDAVAVDAGKRRRHQFFAQLTELFEQRARGWREIKPVGAAIIRIGPAFDQAAGR